MRIVTVDCDIYGLGQAWSWGGGGGCVARASRPATTVLPGTGGRGRGPPPLAPPRLYCIAGPRRAPPPPPPPPMAPPPHKKVYFVSRQSRNLLKFCVLKWTVDVEEM